VKNQGLTDFARLSDFLGLVPKADVLPILDDPGTAPSSLAECRNSAQARGVRAMRSYMVSAKLIQLMFDFIAGEVAERFKAHAWKACVG
jgi:hypothetical protein